MNYTDNYSYLTAIKRIRPSRPLKYLNLMHKLKGNILDYGSGKGFDADYLKCDRYDPFYHPIKPTKKYDTILCSYVLNTTVEETQKEILNNIKKLLKKNGTAYITVRRGIPPFTYTRRKTIQRLVYLDFPIETKNQDYCIYRMDNEI